MRYQLQNELIEGQLSPSEKYLHYLKTIAKPPRAAPLMVMSRFFLLGNNLQLDNLLEKILVHSSRVFVANISANLVFISGYEKEWKLDKEHQ